LKKTILPKLNQQEKNESFLRNKNDEEIIIIDGNRIQYDEINEIIVESMQNTYKIEPKNNTNIYVDGKLCHGDIFLTKKQINFEPKNEEYYIILLPNRLFNINTPLLLIQDEFCWVLNLESNYEDKFLYATEIEFSKKIQIATLNSSIIPKTIHTTYKTKTKLDLNLGKLKFLFDEYNVLNKKMLHFYKNQLVNYLEEVWIAKVPPHTSITLILKQYTLKKYQIDNIQLSSSLIQQLDYLQSVIELYFDTDRLKNRLFLQRSLPETYQYLI
jgi:hypothetical protein